MAYIYTRLFNWLGLIFLVLGFTCECTLLYSGTFILIFGEFLTCIILFKDINNLIKMIQRIK